MRRAAAGQAPGQAAQPGGKQRQRRDGGQGVGGEVEGDAAEAGDGECRQHNPEVRAAGGAVQQSDAQRGVRVFVACAGVRLAKVCVDVRVPNAEVIVFVGVDAVPQQGADAQRADGGDDPPIVEGEPGIPGFCCWRLNEG